MPNTSEGICILL